MNRPDIRLRTDKSKAKRNTLRSMLINYISHVTRRVNFSGYQECHLLGQENGCKIYLFIVPEILKKTKPAARS